MISQLVPISTNRLDVFFCLCPKALHKFAVVSKELVERLVLDIQWTSETNLEELVGNLIVEASVESLTRRVYVSGQRC